MCGLTGFYPSPNSRVNLDKLAYIAVINESRGGDSTGIAIGPNLMKDMGSAIKFLNNRMVAINAVDRGNLPVIIHTRSASYKVGINITQAHPFCYNIIEENNEEINIIDYFVGMHNGLIKEEQKFIDTFIKPSVPEIKKEAYSVDSQIIIHALALCKSIEEISTILSSYDGNAALIFYNKNTFYVWKGGNLGVEERPLYYARNEEGWYFSSIKDSLCLVSKDTTEVLNNQLLVFSEGEMRESLIIPRNIKSYVHQFAYATYEEYGHRRHGYDQSLFRDGSPNEKERPRKKEYEDRLQLPSHTQKNKEHFLLSHKLLFQDSRDKTTPYYEGAYTYNPMSKTFTVANNYQSTLPDNTVRHSIYFRKGIALKRKPDEDFEKLMSRITNDAYSSDDLKSFLKISIYDYIYNFIPVTKNKRVIAILYLDGNNVKVLTPLKDSIVEIDLFGKSYTFYCVNGLFKAEYNSELK
jgi:predicted glutamine amidotransferase